MGLAFTVLHQEQEQAAARTRLCVFLRCHAKCCAVKSQIVSVYTGPTQVQQSYVVMRI